VGVPRQKGPAREGRPFRRSSRRTASSAPPTANFVVLDGWPYERMVLVMVLVMEVVATGA